MMNEHSDSSEGSMPEHPEERRSGGPPALHDNGDHPPPPRRQHKYTTAGLQPERPWKRYLLICLAFLVMIAIVVLLSIFLQKLFDPPEDKDWSDDAVAAEDDELGTVSGESALLPKNAEQLATTCSEEQLSADPTACEQVCAPAFDCCNPYVAGNSTCFEEQVAGCVTYSQCHALGGTTDAAYNDLGRICSMDSLAVGRRECELACTTLSCCYTDIDSCAATNFQACLDYAPCQNLKASVDNPDANPDFIAAAAPTLDDQCRKGEAVCARECREATCCSNQNSDCYRDNFLSCLTYATCNSHEDSTAQITVAPIYSRVEKAPANLGTVCMQTYVNGTGATECEAACAAGACCSAEGVDSCFGGDPLGCLEYEGCAVLKQQATQGSG